MKKVAYYLLVAGGLSWSVWNAWELHAENVRRDTRIWSQITPEGEPELTAPPPPRVSVTDRHLRTCRKFCRQHGQYPVRRIDVQGASVRCVCSGASAPDAELGE